MATNGMIKTVLSGLNDEVQAAPMKTGEAKGWRQTYKWVSLPTSDGKDNDEQIAAATEWSEQQFGKPGGRWFEKKADKKSRFYFRLEKDLSLFILRWS